MTISRHDDDLQLCWDPESPTRSRDNVDQDRSDIGEYIKFLEEVVPTLSAEQSSEQQANVDRVFEL